MINNTHYWLFNILKKQRVGIYVLTLLQVVFAVLTTIYPLITLMILNSIESKSKDNFFNALILMIISTVVHTLLIYYYNIKYENVRLSIELRFKKYSLARWLERNDFSKEQESNGELLNRLSNDTTTITTGCLSILPNILSTVIRLATTAIFLFLLVPKFTYGMILGSIFMLFGANIVKKKMKNIHKDVSQENGKVISYLQEVFSNSLIIRSFGMERLVLENNNKRIEKYRDVSLKRNFLLSRNKFLVNVIFSSAVIVGITITSIEIINGTMSIGTYVAVAQLVAQSRAPLTTFSTYISQYYSTIASAERVMDITEKEEDDFEKKELDFVPKHIKLNNVSFEYPTSAKKQLYEDSLTVSLYDTIAIIGESGCGKSTFLRLLAGLYNIKDGEIVLEDITGKHIVLTKEYVNFYRSLFAYVPQGNGLMSGSIRDCVTLEKRENQNEEQLIKALKLSCSWDFVKNLKDGLDTVLGENGEGLSSGQMQRIAIARALYSNRPYLIFDEATSALDLETERQLIFNLSKITDKTLIIVTHRREILSICNKVWDFTKYKKEDCDDNI